MSTTECPIVDEDGRRCREAVEGAAPVGLCINHLLLANDWVSGEYGMADVLPSPCMACGSRLGLRYPSGWLCAICEWRVGDIPELSGTAVRVDVVYYIGFRERIKIGTTANPRQRIASLPHDVVLAFELGDRVLEQRRHAQFADYRLARSEWFLANPALQAHVRELGAGGRDPWEQYAFWVSRELARHG